MSDIKTPTFTHSEADEHYADQAQADNRPSPQSAYVEDPLVELARIVSESAHTPSVTSPYEDVPQPQGEAAPEELSELQEYSLPEDFGSGLEAELMAELAPSYPTQPAAAQSEPQPVQQQPRARQPASAASRVTHPLPRATPHMPPDNIPAHSILASEARAARVPEPAQPTHHNVSLGGRFNPMAYSASEPDYAPGPVQPPRRASEPEPEPYIEPISPQGSAAVDESASYADAAVEALEAAVQEELRRASFGNPQPSDYSQPQGYASPEDFSALGGYSEDYSSDSSQEPVAPQPQEPAAPEPEDVVSPVQGGVLRGSFDQDFAPSYGQESYSVESDVYVEPTPIRAPEAPAASPEPRVAQNYVEPRFDPDDMQWPSAEPAQAAQNYDEPRVERAVPGYERPVDDGGIELNDIFEADEAESARVAQDVLPEHPAVEKRAAPQAEPKRRGMIVAVAVATVVIIGGGAFAIGGLFGGDGPSGPPVRITAAKGPFKVFPEPKAASSEPTPSKSIYDRVAGVEPRDEQLVPREEEPISSVPTIDDGSPRSVTGENVGSSTPAQPKRVRTVVVRPDGTIIAASDLPGSSATADAPQAATAPTLDTTPQAMPGANANIRTVATRPANEVGAATSTDTQDTAEARVPMTPERTAENGEAATGDVVTLMPRPKPDAPETRVAAATPVYDAPIQRTGPLDLTGGNAAQPAASPRLAASTASTAAVPAGSYVVQISSQRTLEQAQAAYASMQWRFPSILGNLQAVYPSVDLGDRGTFYRVRIVAGDQAEADDLCSRLKTAGGDCFVRYIR
ncbi:SPOR domain-containing protein [Breoghania sp.]|uniref:SPOR domain-containing protein n=1 Tax=Breoghania sp. TaxID=2065378 RepID=UPI002604F859|nr:SPOR domain-containing protein [Breoghania sp.]MDJ0929630.1 SPOR domain-containing protein [Breoghania sp.]